MAAVVEIGSTQFAGEAPEIEDHTFDRRHTHQLWHAEPTIFWEMLEYLAKRRLSAIFGPDLRRRGPRSVATDQGKGWASLGYLIPLGRPGLRIERGRSGRDSIRMELSDGYFPSLDLSVTDLRLYQHNGAVPNRDLVHEIAERISDGTPVILSVGLTRPYAARDDEAPLHWLQVNNIHLKDDPTWRLTSQRQPSTGIAPIDDGDLEDLPF